MARVCDQFSPFLFHVNDIRIIATQSSSWQDNVDGEQLQVEWLELIRAFSGATDLWVAGELASAILCALGLVDGGHVTVLPSLRHLRIDNPMAMNGPSLDALLSFVTLRSRSGHPIQVNVPFEQCHICHANFREQKGLELHLVDEHGYRVLCSYCRDCEFSKGQDESFFEHFESKHPGVLYNDPPLWNPLIPLIKQHSYLQAPDTVAPSTTATAPHVL
ncbi:hypothetical protein EDB84DRAFT_1539208 [Lactarius hengduanensis]|nr:hypothetical protein EDB84DRAFT_1539208 [Lactarius hengduanensis]